MKPGGTATKAGNPGAAGVTGTAEVTEVTGDAASAEFSGASEDPAWNPIPTRTLVHALVRTDGTVDAGELYTVAGLLSMTDQQVRLCVKRLVAEGRFTHEGRGRKAVLRAVADPTGTIAPDAAHVRFAYRQDRGLDPWDGSWHLFAFAVPESARAARDALRDTLLGLGAAPLQGACTSPPTRSSRSSRPRPTISASPARSRTSPAPTYGSETSPSRRRWPPRSGPWTRSRPDTTDWPPSPQAAWQPWSGPKARRPCRTPND